ncbi:hypothetical protein JCM6882_000268 [Rhodosporidiobolus microsporus]
MAQRLKPQQAVDQHVTLQSSLQQVKTLLDAGIGCITYLRGLFPEEAFDDRKLLAPRPPMTRKDTNAKEEARAKDDGPSSVRVKQLKRGSSDEVDKLMDYLDKGAAEAIEKGYLQQLIFAIYLDPEEPTNIVEAYTFTFSYETDPQGNKRPELVVQNQLSGMVISSSAGSTKPDERRKDGEVKRQVQQMIKNIITSTQLLDELPRRRFLNVRLLYTDETPTEYEPPCFKPVAVRQPGYSFATPGCDEGPDISTLGHMSTGFHGVAVHSVSVAHLLDTAYDETLSKDAALLRNRQDASSRPVIWDAETLTGSATDQDARIVIPEPVAIKNEEGELFTLEAVKTGMDDEMGELRKKVGLEYDASAVKEAKGEVEESFLDSHLSDNENLRMAIAAADPDQQHPTSAAPTQYDPVVSRQRSYRPPVPLFDETNEQYAARTALSQGLSQAGPSKNGIGSSQLEAVEEEEEEVATPPVDTQLFEYSQYVDAAAQVVDTGSGPEPDTINTVTQQINNSAAQKAVPTTKSKKKKAPAPAPVPSPARPARKSTRNRHKMADDACECGDRDEDGGMICCGTCEVWKHCSCYGYTSLEDSRLPEDFVCYRCRAEAGKNESLLDPVREGEIEEALAELRSLALFRRALAVVWQNGVLSMNDLAERLAIDNATAAQVLKRLQAEEFIYEQTPPRRLGGKGKSQIGSLKKGPLVVDKTPKMKKKKGEYFNPGRGVEYSMSIKLDPSDADAEGEADDLACLPPLTDDEPSAAGPSAASKAQPPSSSARAPAVLVEDSPSPAQQQNGRPNAMDEDDPILDPSTQPDGSQSLLPYSTPQETIESAQQQQTSASSPNAKKTKNPPPAPRSYHEQEKQQQDPPRAPYVPKFDKGKGKAKAYENKQDDPFHRATSFKQAQNPSAMLVDETIESFTPTAATTNGKRRRSNGYEDEDHDAHGADGVISGAKRPRASEGEREIEV